MVVKSRDPLFKIPKTPQNCSSKLNSTEHIWILVSATNLRSLYLVQHSLSFFFFFLLTSLRAARSGWSPPVPLTGGYTCEHRLLQLACRSLCIPPPKASRCYLSTAKYHSNSRAGLPAPLRRRRTAPAELWVASNDPIYRPEDTQRDATRGRGCARTSDIQKMQFNHSP